jgi:Golgi phosphoprotein 3
MKKTIYLHEEFMLLALREETGTIETSVYIEYPLAAAILSELLLQKRIELDEAKKRKQLVNLVNSTPLGDPILDEALEKIRKAKRRASLKTWVGRMAHLKKLKHRTALQLCKRGILRAHEDKVLLIFKRGIYPELDPGPEKRLVERLRKVIFTDVKDIEPRDAIIIALAHHTHLLKKKFDKKDLKERGKRIKQIAESSLAAKAVKELMDAINVAIIAAIS